MEDFTKVSSSGERITAPRCGHPDLDPPFDFTKAEEINPLPLHEVELRLADYRRHGHVAHDVSLQEFVAMMGITWEDTLNPDSRESCLAHDASLREYYGDPDDDAYRIFRESLEGFAASEGWLKKNHFLEKCIYEDYARLKRFEDVALQLDDMNDDESIATLESQVYSEVYSEAHRKFIRSYRQDNPLKQMSLRLARERCRRAAAAPESVTLGTLITTDSDEKDTQNDIPYNRQWGRRSYKERFLAMYRGRMAPSELE